METRRVSALVLAAGLLLLASPLYVPLVLVPGPLVLLVDPLSGALGYAPGGTLFLIGISYVVVAVAGLSTERVNRPTVDVLAAALQLAAILLYTVWPIRPATLPGFVALGLSVVIPLYALVFAYPLYRYGRRLSKE